MEEKPWMGSRKKNGCNTIPRKRQTRPLPPQQTVSANWNRAQPQLRAIIYATTAIDKRQQMTLRDNWWRAPASLRTRRSGLLNVRKTLLSSGECAKWCGTRLHTSWIVGRPNAGRTAGATFPKVRLRKSENEMERSKPGGNRGPTAKTTSSNGSGRKKNCDGPSAG
jgi:hypothetical protein